MVGVPGVVFDYRSGFGFMSNEVKSGESIGETLRKVGIAATERTIPLQIHFIKGSNFRVVYASGAWFGGDAQQNIHLTFFNERTPIPQRLILNLNEQGTVVGEDTSKRVSKEGVIREMEVDVVFSVPSAVEFYRALGENLKALKAI
jgi:hypothetical protein